MRCWGWVWCGTQISFDVYVLRRNVDLAGFSYFMILLSVLLLYLFADNTGGFNETMIKNWVRLKWIEVDGATAAQWEYGTKVGLCSRTLESFVGYANFKFDFRKFSSVWQLFGKTDRPTYHYLDFSEIMESKTNH